MKIKIILVLLVLIVLIPACMFGTNRKEGLPGVDDLKTQISDTVHHPPKDVSGWIGTILIFIITLSCVVVGYWFWSKSQQKTQGDYDNLSRFLHNVSGRNGVENNTENKEVTNDVLPGRD